MLVNVSGELPFITEGLNHSADLFQLQAKTVILIDNQRFWHLCLMIVSFRLRQPRITQPSVKDTAGEALLNVKYVTPLAFKK